MEKHTTVLHVTVMPKYQLMGYVLIILLFLVMPFVPLLLTEDVVLVLVTISNLLVGAMRLVSSQANKYVLLQKEDYAKYVLVE